MNSVDESDHGGSLLGGCAIALSSAAITCLMLFINGALVWALLRAFSESGPGWTNKPEVTQFLLFVVPVLLVVAEWMMIDYVRSRLSQRTRRE